MKKVSAKKFESRPVKIAVALGLAVGALAVGFTAEHDAAKAVSTSLASKEVSKPAPKPVGLRMSEMGKIALPGNTSETVYACISYMTNTETFLIDQVVVNSPKGTYDEFHTKMIDRSEDNGRGKILAQTPEVNNWGIGNNPANSITQEKIINPKADNYISFYGVWNGPHATVGAGGAIQSFYKQSSNLSDKITNC